MALDIYDKISIDENYGSEMQKRSHVWESANSRKNAADMPNATTVVFMEDTHDGGVTITTGDFVAFFNRQYGCDRVGNMRRSLAQAKRNCELKEAKEGKARAKSDAKPQAQRASRRPLRPRFSFDVSCVEWRGSDSESCCVSGTGGQESIQTGADQSLLRKDKVYLCLLLRGSYGVYFRSGLFRSQRYCPEWNGLE